MREAALTRQRQGGTWLRLAVLASSGALCLSVAPARGSTPKPGPAPAPVITSVTFQGSPAKPLVLIHGHNFGTRPAADPLRGVSNFGFCGPMPAPAGFDFGSQLWLEDETQRWSGGYSHYVDCIGLIVLKYKDTEIVYKFGSWYHIHFGTRNRFPHGIYGLFSGDFVNFKVRGVNFGVTVRYQPLTRPNAIRSLRWGAG